MSKVSYSPEAKQDLKEIKKYYEQDLRNPSASKKILKAITQRVRTLENYPKSGRKLSAIVGFETDYRIIGCSGYLAFYRILDDDVYIVRIFHGKRDTLLYCLGIRNWIFDYVRIKCMSGL